MSYASFFHSDRVFKALIQGSVFLKIVTTEYAASKLSRESTADNINDLSENSIIAIFLTAPQPWFLCYNFFERKQKLSSHFKMEKGHINMTF